MLIKIGLDEIKHHTVGHCQHPFTCNRSCTKLDANIQIME